MDDTVGRLKRTYAVRSPMRQPSTLGEVRTRPKHLPALPHSVEGRYELFAAREIPKQLASETAEFSD